jgi:hypothetical protein
MRLVSFPGHDDESVEQAWLVELESALSGDADVPVAGSWRELRDDVRALARPTAPDFEQRLRAQVAAHRVRPRLPRLRLRPSARPAIVAIACVLCAALVTVVAIAPWQGSHLADQPLSMPLTPKAASHAAEAAPQTSSASGQTAASSEAIGSPQGGSASAPGRVQQLGASITLAVAPTAVQETADRVSRLAVRDGGFVQSSHIQVQQGSAGEANLLLELQSEKLSAALAALEQIAPVRDESQSLQDITHSYNAARQRLSDISAERQAVLHALSKASSEGEIDSLRERLAQSRSESARAHAALEAVSRRARTAEVEVSVLGDAHATSEGLTLHRGLHDAGRVLTVVLVVLLIAAAVLVPLALVVGVLLLARRSWRRRQREHALDAV